MVKCPASAAVMPSKLKKAGEMQKNIAPINLIKVLVVNSPIRSHAKRACSKKHIQYHKPKYWKVAGSAAEKILKNNARSGIESE